MAAPEISHGRGGAGNINPDDTKYVDGEIVRTGEVGSHQDGAYSTGRGGAANIADVGAKSAARLDKDSIPAEAVRQSVDAKQDYHVGRGGAGNEHRDISQEKTAGAKARAEGGQEFSFADKLKHFLLPFTRKSASS